MSFGLVLVFQQITYVFTVNLLLVLNLRIPANSEKCKRMLDKSQAQIIEMRYLRKVEEKTSARNTTISVSLDRRSIGEILKERLISGMSEHCIPRSNLRRKNTPRKQEDMG